MKKFLLLMTILILSSPLYSQEKFIEAHINKDCITKPGTITIDKQHIAANFEIVNINAGYNCYSGGILKTSGYTIKDSSGKIVFSNTSDKKLENLQVKSGIYKIYVDGGRGAYLKLRFMLKSI